MYVVGFRETNPTSDFSFGRPCESCRWNLRCLSSKQWARRLREQLGLGLRVQGAPGLGYLSSFYGLRVWCRGSFAWAPFEETLKAPKVNSEGETALSGKVNSAVYVLPQELPQQNDVIWRDCPEPYTLNCNKP